jgi:hypothetical protein
LFCPGKRGPAERGIEVVVAMYPEDMEALDKNAMWRGYLV